MFYNRFFYLFLSLITTFQSIYTQSHEVTPFVLFLRKLSYIMWHSFFFASRIVGALLTGNKIYIVQALLLLIITVIIESYLLHRFIKTPFKIVFPRFFLINIIAVLAQLAIAHPLFYLIDLHNYAQSIDAKIYSLYALTITASAIVLTFRIMLFYFAYQAFDRTTDRKVLFKAIVRTNCISYTILVTFFFIIKSLSCNFI